MDVSKSAGGECPVKCSWPLNSLPVPGPTAIVCSTEEAIVLQPSGVCTVRCAFPLPGLGAPQRYEAMMVPETSGRLAIFQWLTFLNMGKCQICCICGCLSGLLEGLGVK